MGVDGRYDLEVLIPADPDLDFVVARFEDFKKYGLVNLNGASVRVVLACSAGSDPGPLLGGWPAGVHVEAVDTPYTQVAQRIHFYYSSVADPATADWYMRVDEDSMTDVGTLLANLRRGFDPDRDYHIGGEFVYNVSPVELRVFSHLGYDWWYNRNPTETIDTPAHEHEASVTSRAALRRILSGADSREYFRLRQLYAEGHGDHGLCGAARMNKIYHTSVKWLTREPDLVHFSPYGGHVCHIHWVCRVRNPHVLGWIDACVPGDHGAQFKKTYWLNRPELKHPASVRLVGGGLIERTPDRGGFDRTERMGLWGVTAGGDVAVILKKQRVPELIVMRPVGGDLVDGEYSLREAPPTGLKFA